MTRSERVQQVELDSLRVLALSRIPRCSHCPRFETLRLAVRDDGAAPTSLPAVPRFCTYQVCAPLARRFEAVPYDLGEVSSAS